VKLSAFAGCLAALLVAASAPAAAQIGEVQLGAVASYGSGDSHGAGGGLVVGVAAGRLAYVGLRLIQYAGATVTYGPNFTVCCTVTSKVRTRTLGFDMDLGVLIPAGPVELIPGVALGAMRYAQRRRLTSDTAGTAGQGLTETTRHAVQFSAAPGLAVQLYLGRFALIPQIQWSLTRDPDLSFPAPHGGFVASLRFVRTIEVGRIRY
jgi:hypothetical protein